MGSVGGIPLQQGLELRLAQVQEAGQRPALMAALDEHWQMGVESSALLALDGAKPNTPPAAKALLPKASLQGRSEAAQLGQRGQNLTPKRRRSVSSTSVLRERATASRGGEGRAPGPARPEALRASQRVPGQQRAPVLVVRQVLRQGLGAQSAELFVQRRHAAGLELPRAVPQQRRVLFSHARQAQHQGSVSLRRRERQEDRGPIADAVGVGLYRRMVLRISWVPGMFAARASTLAKILRVAGCKFAKRSLVKSPRTGFSPPLTSV